MNPAVEPLVLAIDTSCDETAAAVLHGRRVLSNVIWSQIEIHKSWGGVVPNLARRAHEEHIDEVVQSAFRRAGVAGRGLDAVAVTVGPGLAIALEVGIKKAKEIAQKYNKPLIAVNHMEGHLLSSLAQNSAGHGPVTKLDFPVLGLLASGGHTQLVLVRNFGDCQLIGETLDDAAGEAFDKVARMLNLGYPGGPLVSELAKAGDPKKYQLPIPMAGHPGFDFSFAGLKTACLLKIKSIPEEKKDKQFLADFSASFERSLVESIAKKLKLAVEKYQPKQILLGGGVINNLTLRRRVRKIAKEFNVPVFVACSKNLLTDNAAMIGVAAYFQYLRGDFVKDISLLDRQPSLNFGKIA